MEKITSDVALELAYIIQKIEKMLVENDCYGIRTLFIDGREYPYRIRISTMMKRPGAKDYPTELEVTKKFKVTLEE